MRAFSKCLCHCLCHCHCLCLCHFLFVSQVMSHQSQIKCLKGHKVSRITLGGRSLNVFVIVFVIVIVIVFVIVFLLVRSCSLITLMKCLKGHKSLGSLCNVVKTLIVSGARPTNQASKGQGHLLSCSGQLKKHNQKTWNTTQCVQTNTIQCYLIQWNTMQ